MRFRVGALGSVEASASILDVLKIRMGCCRPLRRVLPAARERKPAEAGKRHAAQLLCGIEALFGGCMGEGFEAKVLDMACDGVRGCIMCENRAPLPGPCQAFAEIPNEPRIVDGRRTDGCLPDCECELASL